MANALILPPIELNKQKKIPKMLINKANSGFLFNAYGVPLTSMHETARKHGFVLVLRSFEACTSD